MPAATAAGASSGGAPAPADPAAARALNEEFGDWLESEWANGAAALDWSDGVRDYIRLRAALAGGAPPAVAPAPTPPAAPPAPAANGGGGGDDDGVFKAVVDEIYVYRQEKKNDSGETISKEGWKGIGKGLLRLIRNEDVHFLDFRPEARRDAPRCHAEMSRRCVVRASQVSEGGGGNEAADEISGQTRYGRPVLSARLLATTPFNVTKRESRKRPPIYGVQTNLWSTDASGKAVFARYNIPFANEAEAKAFAKLADGCKPSA